jgi:pyruvyltransferase
MLSISQSASTRDACRRGITQIWFQNAELQRVQAVAWVGYRVACVIGVTDFQETTCIQDVDDPVRGGINMLFHKAEGFDRFQVVGHGRIEVNGHAKRGSPFDGYEVDHEKLLLVDGKVPLTHWPVTANFGDALSPWLFQQITGKETLQNAGEIPTYIAVGSILNRVRNQTIVWGPGSFGPEPPRQINNRATYHAVRGPLTRSRVLDRGGKCPRIYGDPALLTPVFHKTKDEKTHEIGLVLRWSDKDWLKRPVGDGVRLIDLGTDDVESVLDDMLACKRIITSSLHGLVIADAYDIPSAWLYSDSPKGREFKFYDYFLSVGKVRHSTHADLSTMPLELEELDATFDFDARAIDFDYAALVGACPLLRKKG